MNINSIVNTNERVRIIDIITTVDVDNGNINFRAITILQAGSFGSYNGCVAFSNNVYPNGNPCSIQNNLDAVWNLTKYIRNCKIAVLGNCYADYYANVVSLNIINNVNNNNPNPTLLWYGNYTNGQLPTSWFCDLTPISGSAPISA